VQAAGLALFCLRGKCHRSKKIKQEFLKKFLQVQAAGLALFLLEKKMPKK